MSGVEAPPPQGASAPGTAAGCGPASPGSSRTCGAAPAPVRNTGRAELPARERHMAAVREGRTRVGRPVAYGGRGAPPAPQVADTIAERVLGRPKEAPA
ncbi:hypothetical protein [Streptomyces sp. CT34]|uniref:hypothetical protein n=1 Tax=Streptomyces sp. CT34 TaxID=1553907 RepID=UPI0012FE824F|nr:hypothetical protein [Streptomyces sp. CT34]